MHLVTQPAAVSRTLRGDPRCWGWRTMPHGTERGKKLPSYVSSPRMPQGDVAVLHMWWARTGAGDSELRDPQPSGPTVALERHHLRGGGRQTDLPCAPGPGTVPVFRGFVTALRTARGDGLNRSRQHPTCWTRRNRRRPAWSPNNVLLPSVSTGGWPPWLPHGWVGHVTTASQ